VDWLAAAGCRLWQILPLGPTAIANSPYQALSSFAGNPLLISLADLQEKGWIAGADLAPFASFPADRVDFDRLIAVKGELLDRAASTAVRAAEIEEREAHDAFVEAERTWLEDAALFTVLSRKFDGRPWVEWPSPLAARDRAALADARRDLAAEVEGETWKQYWFYRQWDALHHHAQHSGLAIIGDVPIYAASNSADVWAHRELFRLDANGVALAVAGVPPDYFSSTGQLWGNPVYDWPRHAESGYAWWIDRVRAGLRLVDILRIDHFRGLEAFWEVPAGLPTAEKGRWVKGPGKRFLSTLRSALGGLPLLAEDLGFVTPRVVALRRAFRLPGMRILQFGLEAGTAGAASGDLPHRYEPGAAAYTGTHDNDTAKGWYASAPEATRDFTRRYLGTNDDGVVPAMVRAIWSSVADWAIVPMQDFLGLGSEARMNRPGTGEGNWDWRMTGEQWERAPQGWLAELNRIYGRTEQPAPA